MKSNSEGFFYSSQLYVCIPVCILVYMYVVACVCVVMKTRVQLWASFSVSLHPPPPPPTTGSLISAVDDSFRRTRGQQASGITACPCLTNSRVVGNAATLSFSTCVLVLPTQVIMLA